MGVPLEKGYRKVLCLKVLKPSEVVSGSGSWEWIYRENFMSFLRDFAVHTKAKLSNVDMEFEDPAKTPSALLTKCIEWWERKISTSNKACGYLDKLAYNKLYWGGEP